MNILQIKLSDGSIYYHSKKGMADANSLRLTDKVDSAQTYSNLKSAKAGISTFQSDLRQAVSLSHWGYTNTRVETVVKLRKQGHQIKVEILEAKICAGNIVETFSI